MSTILRRTVGTQQLTFTLQKLEHGRGPEHYVAAVQEMGFLFSGFLPPLLNFYYVFFPRGTNFVNRSDTTS